MKNTDLRKVGLKVTVPRTKILEMLEKSTGKHVSAEDIYKSLLASGHELGLATVYRVLTQFEAAGIISRLNFEGGQAVYELNDGAHHDHLVCVKCNHVDEFVDDVIEARQRAIAEQFGYRITDHALNIFGLCKNCQ